MNCDKLNKVLSVSSSSYTAPTTLGIKVEQISANIFSFLTFFYIYGRGKGNGEERGRGKGCHVLDPSLDK